MNGLTGFILIQFLCFIAIFLVIRATIREGRNAIFYWIIAGLYFLVIVSMLVQIVNIAKTANGVNGFFIGKYTKSVTGFLTVIVVIVYGITEVVQK
jgi:hypothetical protein